MGRERIRAMIYLLVEEVDVGGEVHDSISGSGSCILKGVSRRAAIGGSPSLNLPTGRQLVSPFLCLCYRIKGIDDIGRWFRDFEGGLFELMLELFQTSK
jgi:hypothetical protein